MSSGTRKWWILLLVLLVLTLLLLLYPSSEEYVRGKMYARVIAWWAREGNLSLLVWGGKNVVFDGVPCTEEGNVFVCPLGASTGSWVEANVCIDGECAAMRFVVD